MSYELYHHGILGQKWGKKNGPPYPLDASDHSSSEKKAGWRKSLSAKSSASEKKSLTKSGKKEYNENEDDGFHLSDKQKTALKIGAAAAATALAAYGTYKLAQSGKLDGLIDKGKEAADSIFGYKDVDGLKMRRKPESLAETLKNVNPNRGNHVYQNNCTLCSITSFLRQQGYEVTAGSTSGMQKNLNGIVEDCFKGATVVDGSATKFGKSKQDAAEMLVKRFGNNASGVCNVPWKGGGGHAFNWSIKDGAVTFFDGQSGKDDSMVSVWRSGNIDVHGLLQIARLDNAEIVPEKIKELLNYK